jgi:hypothetical protein
MEMEIKVSADHNFIRKWVEDHKGRPAIVRRTIYNDAEQDPGVLAVVFESSSRQDSFEEISWGRFFLIFEEKNLALAYKQGTSDGKPSFFYDFIPRPGSKSSVPAANRGTA